MDYGIPNLVQYRGKGIIDKVPWNLLNNWIIASIYCIYPCSIRFKLQGSVSWEFLLLYAWFQPHGTLLYYEKGFNFLDILTLQSQAPRCHWQRRVQNLVTCFKGFFRTNIIIFWFLIFPPLFVRDLISFGRFGSMILTILVYSVGTRFPSYYTEILWILHTDSMMSLTPQSFTAEHFFVMASGDF